MRHAASSSVDASATVEVDLDAAGAANGSAGDSVVVTLREGAVLTDRVARPLQRGEHLHTVPVSFTPTRPGLAALRVEASIVRGGEPAGVDGSPANSAADFAIAVREARRSVLVHDARPSWMSTFVRRALELDPRLTVTSRTVTSRGIATEAGRPPAIASLDAASAFDVVVLGAPEALGAREVGALESFLRRGGSVVLLLDQRASGPYERLTRTSSWSSQTEAEPAALRPSGGLPTSMIAGGPDTSPVLRATEWIAPRGLPAGATSLLEMPSRIGARGLANQRRSRFAGGERRARRMALPRFDPVALRAILAESRGDVGRRRAASDLGFHRARGGESG